MGREIVRRIGEAASLVSCALNVVIGTGDREITLSAGAWELRRRGTFYGSVLVWCIDRLPWNLRGWRPAQHCLTAWTDHAPVWIKVRAERG